MEFGTGIDTCHSAGAAGDPYRRPAERPFSAAQRGRTTLLFGGLTPNHEKLIQGGLEVLGYRCEHLPVPDREACRTGREYGNVGQCSPAHFTVGNLVKYLQGLRRSGLTTERILDEYVFFTAGACGPCRFGMYAEEYRLALRNAGFGGFRVLPFQQKQGLVQGSMEAGLRLDLAFFLALLTGFLLGDLLNAAGHRMRPYELERGSSDRALDRCRDLLYRAIRSHPAGAPQAVSGTTPGLAFTLTLLRRVRSRHIPRALAECRRILAGVRLDRSRAAPLVRITGEFWAQTTEGAGNYDMFRFLEGEGAEVAVEPLTAWLLHLMWQVGQGERDRFGLPGRRNPLRHLQRLARLALGSRLLERTYRRYGRALGVAPWPIPPQGLLARLAHPWYHSRAQGGESFLEVAKAIQCAQTDGCHLLLSLKPFGCLPSTQSDGVMAAVTARYPQLLFLALETSGEGEIDAHSRVLMVLEEARRRARAERDAALAAAGLGLEAVRRYLARHRELASPLLDLPPAPRCAGTAAAFVVRVARHMGAAR